ncbi:MAG: hypothetical protein Q4B96_01495 [Bacillota bacterium]|nr:hypothetical protein [Bacillota bacterium]
MAAFLLRPFDYHSEERLIPGRKGEIKIENLTPVLSGEEQIEQRRCIEEGLFDIFSKYAGNTSNMNGYSGAAAV